MKSKFKSYISSLLVVILVVAFGSKLFAAHLCDCHSHGKVHTCCSCETHMSDCSHHDLKFSHHCVFDDTLNDEFVYKQSDKVYRYSASVTTILILNLIGVECLAFILASIESKRLISSRYILCESHPSLEVKALRAPPVCQFL